MKQYGDVTVEGDIKFLIMITNIVVIVVFYNITFLLIPSVFFEVIATRLFALLMMVQVAITHLSLFPHNPHN